MSNNINFNQSVTSLNMFCTKERGIFKLAHILPANDSKRFSTACSHSLTDIERKTLHCEFDGNCLAAMLLAAKLSERKFLTPSELFWDDRTSLGWHSRMRHRRIMDVQQMPTKWRLRIKRLRTHFLFAIIFPSITGIT